MRMMLPGFPGISPGLDVVKRLCRAAGAEAEKGGQNSGGGKPQSTQTLSYATPLMMAARMIAAPPKDNNRQAGQR